MSCVFSYPSEKRKKNSAELSVRSRVAIMQETDNTFLDAIVDTATNTGATIDTDAPRTASL